MENDNGAGACCMNKLGDIFLMTELRERLPSMVQKGIIQDFGAIVVKAKQSSQGRHHMLRQWALEHDHEFLEDVVDGLKFVVADAELAAQVPLRLLDRRD
jgi:hypothetical protein